MRDHLIEFDVEIHIFSKGVIASLQIVFEKGERVRHSWNCGFVGENVARDVAPDVALDVARGSEDVDSLESLIVNMIAKDKHVTRTEMAEVAKVSTKTIERQIKQMQDKVRYVGVGRKGHWEILK